MKTARQMALDILYAVFYEGKFSNKLIQKSIDQSHLSDADKRLARNIIYGVLERVMTLDYYISKLSSVKLKKIEARTLIILRMAMYQIAYLDKIPNAAAVDEAVKMTKVINFKSAGFVNGILRSFLRWNGKYPMPDATKDTVTYLSVKYSHPTWLVQRWLEQFGKDTTIALLEADNEVPKVSIRVNLLKTNREKLAKALQVDGYIVTLSELIEEAIIIEHVGSVPLHELETFKEGHFFIQDLSAMLVAKVAMPQMGQQILDLCAAPGGKSTHLAELMKNSGSVIARDVSDYKVSFIEENAKRLGLSNIRAEQGDALLFNENDIEKYDTLIVDAPCSGLGIIRRKPEIRYNRKLEDLAALSAIQKDILRHAVRYVKPGGSIVYSTCTIDPLENDDVVEWFLENFTEFQLAPLDEPFKSVSHSQSAIKIYQTQDGMDGFYIVKLIKMV